MGLDMYLKAKVYVSGYEHSAEEDQKRYRRAVGLVGLEAVADPGAPSAEVSVTVAYWRKANAIHGWFVRNVQDGEDDCGDYYVTREQLHELRYLCRKVLEVANVAEGQPVHSGTTYRAGGVVEEHFQEGRAILNSAEVAELLPTAAGFFFGTTGYDEWYLRDIERTVEVLDRVLENDPDTCSFYYRASW